MNIFKLENNRIYMKSEESISIDSFINSFKYISKEKFEEEVEKIKLFSAYKKIKHIEEEWYSRMQDLYSLEDKVVSLKNKLKNEKNENEKINISSEISELIGSFESFQEGKDFSEESAKSKIISDLNDLEEMNPFLKDIKKGDMSTRPLIIKDRPDLEKKFIAAQRDKEVRTVEDSIADLAKMNSLLFSCISAMYGTMSDTAKSKIDEGTKELIDYSVEKFSNTQTRADRQLIKEGTGLVDKLFEREVQIADIIDEVKGE